MEDRLLKILKCPSSGNPLTFIDQSSLREIDLPKEIHWKRQSHLEDSQNKSLLLNIDSKIAYPIIDDIPMIDNAYLIDLDE